MVTSPAGHRVHVIDDGRGGALLTRVWGPVDGTPVIFHHGTPSCSFAVPGGWSAADELGIQMITFDRPGYGQSSDWVGRTVGDAAAWTKSIADALGFDTFAVMGTSGGGPHAYAAAAGLGARVAKLCVSVGLGPVGLQGFDELDGLPADTVTEVDAARRGEADLRAFINGVMDGPGLDLWLDALPASDLEVLSREEVRAEEAAEDESWRARGIEGWLEDDMAIFARPWECAGSSIEVPTTLIYGESDVLVPVSHGYGYSRDLPHAHFLTIPNAGHWMRDHERSILRWLVSPDDAPPDVAGANVRS